MNKLELIIGIVVFFIFVPIVMLLLFIMMLILAPIQWLVWLIRDFSR